MNNAAESLFTQFHHNRTWAEICNTTDGPGSTLEYTTTIRQQLPALLKKWDIKSMLDASCGEFIWMREVDLSGINYIGGEIVADKIQKLSQEFPQHTWLHLDIIEDNLPSVDMWMCRDTLFHFPHEYLKKTLQNFLRSDIKYLLTSSHPDVEANEDFSSFGDFRPNNFNIAPFNFGEPLDVIDDTGPGWPLKRHMYLYSREQMSGFSWLI